MKKQITITNRVEDLQRVSLFVNHIADELQLNDELRMNLGLALEEMVSNVIFYAYPEDTEASIDLTAESDGQTLTLVISDQGQEFDPTLAESNDMDADPAERPLGGMGIFIMKNIMNNVSYQRLDGHNLLTMKKEIKNMRTFIISAILALACQTADAQIGKFINKVKNQTQEVIEGAVNKATESVNKAYDTAEKEVRDAVNDETAILYGDHSYTMQGNIAADKYRKHGFGKVTFTNIPADYAEFEAIYTKFLGLTPHGAAAMMPMAIEMYARDREVGKKCIELLCYPSNVNSVISILRDKFGATSDAGYGQRYLPAATLKGATPENGYQPEVPYTVEMEASVNEHQELEITGKGTVMYLYIMGGGWDTKQRAVEIIKQPDSELHKVFNCPALYTQCKAINGTWNGLK